MIEFPVPKFMCNNRNYLILITTLKSANRNRLTLCTHANLFMKQSKW
jgi:hypothetical protein